MRKKWKGYLVFTSSIYRIAMFGLVPAGLVAAGAWGGVYIGDIGLMLMVMFLPFVEIFSDSWLFGGIQAKDMEKMDYLKTSGLGMTVIRDALCADLFRKLINAFATISICYIAMLFFEGEPAEGFRPEMLNWMDFIRHGGPGQEVAFGLYMVLLAYFVSVLGTFLSRYASMLYINLMIGYGAMVLMVFGLFGPGLRIYLWGGIFLLDVLLAVLGFGASVLTVKIAMKKVEGGYHDA